MYELAAVAAALLGQNANSTEYAASHSHGNNVPGTVNRHCYCCKMNDIINPSTTGGKQTNLHRDSSCTSEMLVAVKL